MLVGPLDCVSAVSQCQHQMANSHINFAMKIPRKYYIQSSYVPILWDSSELSFSYAIKILFFGNRNNGKVKEEFSHILSYN